MTKPILCFILGVLIAILGIMTYEIMVMYNKLWITVSAVLTLNAVNYIISAFMYYEVAPTNKISKGDLYIATHGSLNFNAPIYLLGLTLLFYSYYMGDKGDFILAPTVLYLIYNLYAQPANIPENEIEES